MKTIEDLAKNEILFKNDFNPVVRLMAKRILDLEKEMKELKEALDENNILFIRR